MLGVVGFLAVDGGVRFPGDVFQGMSAVEAHDTMVTTGHMWALLAAVGALEFWRFTFVGRASWHHLRKILASSPCSPRGGALGGGAPARGRAALHTCATHQALGCSHMCSLRCSLGCSHMCSLRCSLGGSHMCSLRCSHGGSFMCSLRCSQASAEDCAAARHRVGGAHAREADAHHRTFLHTRHHRTFTQLRRTEQLHQAAPHPSRSVSTPHGKTPPFALPPTSSHHTRPSTSPSLFWPQGVEPGNYLSMGMGFYDPLKMDTPARRHGKGGRLGGP